MVYKYQRGSHSTNRSGPSSITSARLQDFNEELDELFKMLDSRNLTFTVDIQNRVTQIVDNTNIITINIDWTGTASNPQFFEIQVVGDPQKFTLTYDNGGYLSSILYA